MEVHSYEVPSSLDEGILWGKVQENSSQSRRSKDVKERSFHSLTLNRSISPPRPSEERSSHSFRSKDSSGYHALEGDDRSGRSKGLYDELGRRKSLKSMQRSSSQNSFGSHNSLTTIEQFAHYPLNVRPHSMPQSILLPCAIIACDFPWSKKSEMFLYSRIERQIFRYGGVRRLGKRHVTRCL